MACARLLWRPASWAWLRRHPDRGRRRPHQLASFGLRNQDGSRTARAPLASVTTWNRGLGDIGLLTELDVQRYVAHQIDSRNTPGR